MIPQRTAVLYTSTSREGAIAEITFHWSQLTPRPSKPAMIHELALTARKTVRIQLDDFEDLGILPNKFGARDYERTQEVGAAAAFLGLDGIFVPSARFNAENLVIFSNEHGVDTQLSIVSSSEVQLSFDDSKQLK